MSVTTTNLNNTSSTPTLQQPPTSSSQNYSVPTDGILPGGRLRKFIQYWKQATSHPWPLSVIQEGYKIQFIRRPIPWRNKTKRISQEDQLHVNEAIEKFLAGGMIEVSPSQNRDYLSNFFTIQEKSKRRPILDCQKLNQFIQVNHFKMEGIPALREIIEPDDFICKIDLKDAYVVVPINEESKDFLTFENQGTVYRYRSLAFGLSVSPRIFSKIMRYALEPLRREGIRLIYYLDDTCVLSRTKEEMHRATERIRTHLEALGFIINYSKSNFTPSKIQEFLGFTFNTRKMKISVPHLKINNTLKRIKLAKKMNSMSCRWLAGLLGKITSMIPAIGEALLHIRYLQRDLAWTLQTARQNWETTCRLSSTSLQELDWWETHLEQKNGLPIHPASPKTPAITIHVDASNTGWGISSPLVQDSGFWTQKEIDQSINVRELKTILFALQRHAVKYKDSTIQIFSDNMTALKYTTKSGGTSSALLQELAIEIQNICNQYNLQVVYQHIPGVLNTAADALSRKKIPFHESTIPKKMFQVIETLWGKRKVDAFAARHNYQLEEYWALQQDTKAAAVDAFQQDWRIKGLYLYPPWKLIPRVLKKIKEQKLKEVVLVTPMWPTQYWYPMILQMKHLTNPITWQLNRRWSLTAWRLSTTTGKKLA